MNLLKSKRFWAVVLLCWAIGGVAAHQWGKHHARLSLQNIERVWPEFQSLSADEKATIGQTALECNLSRLPSNVDIRDVMGCLRTGAVILDRAHPTFRIPDKLERLLAVAPGK